MTTYKIAVRLEAPVNPTEVEERVVETITTLFPESEVATHGDRVTATTHDVSHFRKRLFQQRILDTARSEFFANRGPNGFSFELTKQAARNDVVNFAVGNPDELGDVQVAITVHEPDVEAFIDYLAPATEDGEPPEYPGE
ncbi:putative RNA binding protein with dsRBD fold [Halanaeroarchaeum sp. HSR-CO]|uniref:RNA-binding domain-containing protein n=1 Tax=Halanaeroarchaeum sp. HSR-CO TaxID=2866382 RepID=UPI00217E257C|nr:RNA-binding domain-containing protein [Halanaeroarchaeum sp. HSR-CO]UWG49073.1 putative RNA binding protein with dsRBD fold [Halanaeroarchaeum sp. HSR-CO]